MPLRNYKRPEPPEIFNSIKEEALWRYQELRVNRPFPFFTLRHYIPSFRIERGFKDIVSDLTRIMSFEVTHRLLDGKSIIHELFLFYLLRSGDQTISEILKSNAQNTEPIIRVINKIKKERNQFYS